jgi:hypothetical protein
MVEDYRKSLGTILKEKINNETDNSLRLTKTYYAKKWAYKTMNNLESEENFTGIRDKSLFYSELFPIINCFHSGDFYLPNGSTSQSLTKLSSGLNYALSIGDFAITFPFKQTFNVTCTPDLGVTGNLPYLGFTTNNNLDVLLGSVAAANLPWINSSVTTAAAGSSWYYVNILGSGFVPTVYNNVNINSSSTQTSVGSAFAPALIGTITQYTVQVSISIYRTSGNTFTFNWMVSDTTTTNTTTVFTQPSVVLNTLPLYFFIAGNSVSGASDAINTTIVTSPNPRLP